MLSRQWKIVVDMILHFRIDCILQLECHIKLQFLKIISKKKNNNNNNSNNSNDNIKTKKENKKQKTKKKEKYFLQHCV